MHFSHYILAAACGIVSARAFSFPSLELLPAVNNLFKRQNSCPTVWTTISAELTQAFLEDGQCNDMARAALRIAFHDQGAFSLNNPFVAPASGGADGSILLNDEEITRIENNNDVIKMIRAFLLDMLDKYQSEGVGAADLISFAANHAVVSCPGGPTVKTVVGREDSSTPAPPFLLPPGFGPGSDHDSILQLFEEKGFSPSELATLMGAHSVAKSFNQAPIPVGAQLDSTPGQLDVKYYDELVSSSPPQDVFRLDSDINLAKPETTVGKQLVKMVGDQSRFQERFADAMYKMSLLGIPQSDVNTFIDCTSALPRGSEKRDIRAAPINARARRSRW